MPLWYGGGSHDANTGYFGGDDAFSSFEEAVAGSISAYNATQSSSASGSGGGGGGGGGSW